MLFRSQIVRQAETIGCQAQIRRMSLDELYEAALKYPMGMIIPRAKEARG